MKANHNKAILLMLSIALILSLGLIMNAPVSANYWGEPIPEGFPRAQTTGPAAGGYPITGLVPTSVTTINNANAVTQAGGSLIDGVYVIENREFSGPVTISLANVTLRGCYIPGRLTISAENVKVDYCEIMGITANSSGFEITNCNLHNANNIVTVGGGVASGLIEGNYMHDLTGDKRGITINSFSNSISGLVIRGNTVLLGPDGYRNYTNNTETNNVSDLLFEGNYFSGSKMAVQFYVLPLSNIVFRNNVFSTFHETAGSWGWLAVGTHDYQNNIILTDTESGPFTFSGNRTLYPEPWDGGEDEWDPETLYLVRFNANDGMMYTYNMPENQQVYGGQLVQKVDPPKRDGYDFGGWYKEGACLTEWDFDNDIVTGDMAFFAKWTDVGFRPPEIPEWYEPLPLPDTTVPNWQIDHEWPNETNVGLLTPKSELEHIYGVVRTSSGGTPDLRWTKDGVEQNPGNINLHDDGVREWVTRQLNSKPDWTHNDNDPLPGITSWTTLALKYGYVYVDENYINQNGGRVTDPESPYYGSFVIENKYINGGLRIDARDVIVRNCYIEACGALWGGKHVDSGTSNLTWGCQGAVYVNAGASLTIANCEINGLEGVHAGIWYDGTRLVALGNIIYNTNDAIYHWERNNDCSNNYLIQDNYFHTFTKKTSNGHTDGWQAGGGSGAMRNGLFRHNNVRMAPRDSGAYANYGPGKYIKVDYNLFTGSGYTIYSYSQSSNPQTNTWFINNVFDDLNGEAPNVGYYGIWFASEPQDGWHRVSSRPSNYYPTVDIDPYNFPINTPSLRYGNIVRSTGKNVDIGNVGEPDLDEESPLPEGWWPNSGYGAALLSQGRKDLGKSWTGEITIEFKLQPLSYPVDSAVAYSHTGVTITNTSNPWASFNILGGARPNGVLGFFNGNGTGSGAWETQNLFNNTFPELTTDAQRAAKIAEMTKEELAAISPYLKKYEAGKVYDIRIHAKTIDQKYTVWARELDENGNPIEDWQCIGENYGFRNISGNDIATLWVGPGGRFSYGVGYHRIYQGPPVDDVNHPPVFETIGEKSVNIGSTLEFTVLAADPDEDQLTYSAENLPAGAAFDAQTRTFSWTPQQGQEGTYQVTFVVSDEENPPVEMIVEITVIPAQSEGMIITAPDEIAPEKNFIATIRFNLNKTILTAGLTISYDPDLVTYKGYEQIEGGLFVAGIKHDANNGTIRVLLSGTDNPITSGTPLVKLKFRSKENEGSCEITVTGAELLDVPGNSIFPEPASKTVAVNYVMPGDANDDGAVNLRDLHFVSTHFWKDTNSEDWNIAKAADVNGDGRIGIEDLTYVASKILNQ